jgi:surfeit locus 1 family protein
VELIRKVETRFYAAAHALPDTAASDPAAHEYERVELTGAYLPGLDTWVHASTVEGAGYWVLSPMRISDNSIVMINRGFVPMDTDRTRVAAAVKNSVTGVLRTSEPSGAWPRRNSPEEDRWYSRELAAIARTRGLVGVAPFFIDADAEPADVAPAGQVLPLGGLTVVQFRNAHLSYAITWFVLALMTAFAGAHALRGELRGPTQRP